MSIYKSNRRVSLRSLRPRFCVLLAAASLFILSGLLRTTAAQSVELKRDRGQQMLKAIKDDLKKNYYDPTFHGMDVDVRFKTASEKIKTATSNGDINGIIAQVLVELEDSHTNFLPPTQLVWVDYGFKLQTIGEICYVVAVKPGSQAADRGLKVGDAIHSIDGFAPSRANLWKIKYSYYVLQPRPGMRLVVRSPNGQTREVELGMKVLKREEREREAKKEKLTFVPRFHEAGDELIICKLPDFIMTDGEISDVMKRIEPHRSLVLDLRGNPGGQVKSVLRFMGYFFERDIRVGDEKTREGVETRIAKTHGEHLFKGRLVVLVDSDSSSAAEEFARIVQLEKRGTVIGDRTRGALRTSRRFFHTIPIGSQIEHMYSYYGASITVADMILPDGKSLEHVGVLPDELLLPTASDLAARRDPVLSRAAALLGVNLSPEQAGTLFPSERKTEVETDEQTDAEK